MTRTLVLHIGHYKTGTTALQVFLEQNAAALQRRGLGYAATHLHRSKHSIYAFSLLRAAGVNSLMHGYSRPDRPEDLWAQLLEEVRSSPARATLISSEEFMRLGGVPAAMERLGAILDAAPDIQVRVIAYLRPIADHLRSWYNQLVKLNLVQGDFDMVLRRRIEPVHYDYDLAIGPWAKLVGPERLVVRPYDDALRRGDAMYRDFLSALGVSLPVWPRIPRKDPNPRLDDRLLDMTRCVTNAQMPEAARAALLERAAAYLDAAETRRKKGEPAVAAIRSRAEAGLQALAERLGPGFPRASLEGSLPEALSPIERERSALVEFLIRELVALSRDADAERARLTDRISELEARLAKVPARNED